MHLLQRVVLMNTTSFAMRSLSNIVSGESLGPESPSGCSEGLCLIQTYRNARQATSTPQQISATAEAPIQLRCPRFYLELPDDVPVAAKVFVHEKAAGMPTNRREQDMRLASDLED
jgi:hypothetical protein